MDFHDVLAVTSEVVVATTRDDAARLFADRAERAGASYFQARLYQRPAGRLTSTSHWSAGGVVLRRAIGGWVDSTGFNYICFEQNPLLAPIRQGMTRYCFSDFAPYANPTFQDYWDAFSHAHIEEGLCATAYGRERMIASVHVGLPTRDVDPSDAQTLSIAASIFVEKLISFAEPSSTSPGTDLSQRERDAIGFVAEGKTDWEIGTILGISDTTARFHVDNARRKLNAVNRSHAVARYIAEQQWV